jgi:hypothetical protein
MLRWDVWQTSGGSSPDVVIDVAELIWEPIAE